MPSFSKIVPSTSYGFYSTSSGGSPSTSARAGRQEMTNTRETDMNLKDFRKLIALGLNATTNLSGNFYEEQHMGMNYCKVNHVLYPSLTPVYDEYKGTDASCCVAPHHVGDNDFSTIDPVALSRFMTNVKAQSQQLVGPTFLGELRETIGMIRRPLSGMFKETGKLLDSLDKLTTNRAMRRIKNISHLLRGASELWLEFSFGVKPLIQDSKDIAITIARLMANERHTVVRGFAKSPAYERTLTRSSNNYTFVDHERHFVTTRMTIYRGGIAGAAQLPVEAHAALWALLGFDDIRTFVPTVVELIPFSWLVGYFVNVDEMLTSLSFSASDVNWVSKTQVTETELVTISRVTTRFPEFLVSVQGQPFWGSSRYILRSVNRRRASPEGLYLPMRWTFPGRRSQVANTLAVVVQRFLNISERAVRASSRSST